MRFIATLSCLLLVVILHAQDLTPFSKGMLFVTILQGNPATKDQVVWKKSDSIRREGRIEFTMLFPERYFDKDIDNIAFFRDNGQKLFFSFFTAEELRYVNAWEMDFMCHYTRLNTAFEQVLTKDFKDIQVSEYMRKTTLTRAVPYPAWSTNSIYMHDTDTVKISLDDVNHLTLSATRDLYCAVVAFMVRNYCLKGVDHRPIKISYRSPTDSRIYFFPGEYGFDEVKQFLEK